APAAVVVLDQQDTPDDPGRLAAAWQGRPVSSGDHIDVPDGGEARIAEVVPNGAGTVGQTDYPRRRADRASTAVPPETNTKTPAEAGRASGSRERMTSDAALLAGLQSQRELLAGWLTLLTSPDDLPATWGLPRVAGVWVEGPPGCGRPELVRAAADDVPVQLDSVARDRISKRGELLAVLHGAPAKPGDRGLILADIVELLTGADARSNYRAQFGAVFRWFLHSVAERRGLAVVLGAS